MFCISGISQYGEDSFEFQVSSFRLNAHNYTHDRRTLMATFKEFEQIESWQKSRELTNKIYKVSSKGAFAKDFGLKDQIRRGPFL